MYALRHHWRHLDYVLIVQSTIYTLIDYSLRSAEYRQVRYPISERYNLTTDSDIQLCAQM